MNLVLSDKSAERENTGCSLCRSTSPNRRRIGASLGILFVFCLATQRTSGSEELGDLPHPCDKWVWWVLTSEKSCGKWRNLEGGYCKRESCSKRPLEEQRSSASRWWQLTKPWRTALLEVRGSTMLHQRIGYGQIYVTRENPKRRMLQRVMDHQGFRKREWKTLQRTAPGEKFGSPLASPIWEEQ